MTRTYIITNMNKTNLIGQLVMEISNEISGKSIIWKMDTLKRFRKKNVIDKSILHRELKKKLKRQYLINENIKNLIRQGYITESNNAYYLTPLGAIIIKAYKQLSVVGNDIIRHKYITI